MPANYVLCSVLQVPRHKNLIRSSRFCPRDAVCRANGRTCVAGVGCRVLGKSMRHYAGSKCDNCSFFLMWSLLKKYTGGEIIH